MVKAKKAVDILSDSELGHTNFAYLMNAVIERASNPDPCAAVAVGRAYNPRHNGFAVRKDSPMKEIMDYHVIR